jgi:hypothetical protein
MTGGPTGGVGNVGKTWMPGPAAGDALGAGATTSSRSATGAVEQPARKSPNIGAARRIPRSSIVMAKVRS